MCKRWARGAAWALAAGAAVANSACDGFVTARVKVVSAQAVAIPHALIRLQGSREHDLARFTDDSGCAHFSGVVGPVRLVRVTIGKPGFQSQEVKLRAIQENCLLVRLAADGEKAKGSVDTPPVEHCTCGSNTGYSPTMSARFKVKAEDGTPLELAAVRQADRPHYPWSQVTDSKGCLGVTWTIPADVLSVPLVLEKSGYAAANVEVPPMEDRCYSVKLARAGEPVPGAVVAVSAAACEATCFQGGRCGRTDSLEMQPNYALKRSSFAWHLAACPGSRTTTLDK
jgi:hypothetical protein